MIDKYVILTGSKNNAGDFLIKFRAKLLFKELRPDREIIDYNAWEPFDEEKLKVINESKALILLGGPSLQKNMWPSIYKMTAKLEEVKVPIITMGIGWKSISGEWFDTYKYSFTESSIKLLNRIDKSTYKSSVRDYHSLNSLNFNGFKEVLMTGCPAYYNLDYLNKPFVPQETKKVAFSLGVSFIESKSMEVAMKKTILDLNEKYKSNDFEVVFHHSLKKEEFLSTHGSTLKHNKKHNEFADWLSKNNIKYCDISGSAENLINYYSKVDLHIGYRVHAHIFMNSISKFSILISEDGRAKGVRKVIGGIVIDGYSYFKQGFLSKVFNRLLPFFDRYVSNKNLAEEIILNISYEKEIDFLRLKSSRAQIDNNYKVMQAFIKQLP